MFDVAVWSHGLAACAHCLFAWYLKSGWQHGRAGGALIAAALGSAFWCVCNVALVLWPEAAWSMSLALFGEVVRYGAWLIFVLIVLDGLGGAGVRSLAWSVVTVLATALLATGVRTQWPTIMPAALIACVVCLLVLVEQLFRRVPAGSRWGFKPICLALTAGVIFDLYFFADTLLFGGVDGDVWAARGAVWALLIPLVGLSAARNRDWTVQIRLSRTAAFHTSALALSGLYLLAIAAVGYYIRYFGGTWGRALQLTLLFGGVVLFGILFFSGAQRARLRVLVNKHLFPYRYDYRVEWQRFTRALAREGEEELGQRVIVALADQVESTGGGLWLCDEEGVCRQQARINHPEVLATEPLEGALCSFLRERDWVVNLAEHRLRANLYDGLALPEWLRDLPEAWLVVPLTTHSGMLGFVVLNEARTSFDVNWEVLDLLKSSQQQAAGYLAQTLATEALLEARKFDSFNRMSAFVVHDLKNLVAQLSLMLKNAERHRDNPEFQQDMLETVTHVEARMRALMQQLQEKTSADPRRQVDLATLLARIVNGERHARPAPQLLPMDVGGDLYVAAHPERLARVIGHLVKNAIDATPADGLVTVSAGMRGEGGRECEVQVRDSGAGMSEEFMRERLFRPFQSSKASGMGIGVYEAQQYLKELGGSLRYASTPGEGTCATVRLPCVQRAEDKEGGKTDG